MDFMYKFKVKRGLLRVLEAQKENKGPTKQRSAGPWDGTRFGKWECSGVPAFEEANLLIF